MDQAQHVKNHSNSLQHKITHMISLSEIMVIMVIACE